MVKPKPFQTGLNYIYKNTTEARFFYFVLIINMLPVLCFRFFPTMDGPAHLYNSRLISELVFNPHSSISEYFLLNNEPVPNWLSHFFLAFGNLMFPAWLAEKILLIGYFTLLPLSFRALIKVYNKPCLSYLIFPFTYSFLFYLGFYNFSLSFIILFYAIRFWILHYKKNSLKLLIFLFLLVSLCYFSHILVYAFLAFALFILLSQRAFNDLITSKFEKKTIIRYLKAYTILILAFLPTMILFIVFFIKRDIPVNNDRLSFSELIRWITEIRPIIALDYNKEAKFTLILYHLMIILTAIVFYQRIQNVDIQNYSFRNRLLYLLRNGLFRLNDAFLFITFIVLLIYFYYPNGAGAGMMSDRLCLLFFIFYIIWLALQVFPKWLNILSGFVIIVVNFGLVYQYFQGTRYFNKVVKPIYKASEYIEPYSTIIPVNNSGLWLDLHFSNYLGVDKPVIVLENYEADVGWFPVLWNSKMPDIKLGNSGKERIYPSRRTSNNNSKPADYVFFNGKMDKNNDYSRAITEELENHYQLVYQYNDTSISLYKLIVNQSDK